MYAAGDAATAHSRSVASAIGTGSRVAYAVAPRAGRRLTYGSVVDSVNVSVLL